MKKENHETIFNKTGFEKKFTIKGSPDSIFAIYAGKIEEKNVVLKIASRDYSLRMEQFEKESIISDLIKKHNKKLKNISAVEVISKGEDSKYKWIIRKFAEGEPLSRYDSSLPLLGYDIISEKFADCEDKIINQVKDLIKNIQEISIPGKFSPLIVSRYPRKLDGFGIPKIEKYLEINLDQQKNFFNNNYSEYLKEGNSRLSIGDLTPANLIVNKNLKIILSDYELFSFENYLMDMTYLWLFLWRYPKWQAELSKGEITSEKEQNFFRMNIIRILLFLYRWPYDCAGGFSPEEKVKLNNSHIWKKYLIASGKSFEAIMKVM